MALSSSTQTHAPSSRVFQGPKKSPRMRYAPGGFLYGGTDGTRTRDLLRDRQEVLLIKTITYKRVAYFVACKLAR